MGQSQQGAWPEIRLKAFNTDPDSDNRIHSDEEAGKYGFEGGLVPGVSVYAYMTQALTARFGETWLNGSQVSTRFMKPVYDGEEVVVRAWDTEEGARVELFKEEESCAFLDATLDVLVPAMADVPEIRPMPEARFAPSVDALPAGTMFGAWELSSKQEDWEAFADNMLENAAHFRGDEGVMHPAWVAANANWMLMANVALGPWIHTGSDINYKVTPSVGDSLWLHGEVAKSYERKGNEWVELDLILAGKDGQLIATMKHTAIVRLAQDK